MGPGGLAGDSFDGTVSSQEFDFLTFGRRYLGPLIELLLGWVLVVYGVLRLLGRVQVGQRGRYAGGGLALAAGGLLLWHSCGRL
jgi:hypothetical protein